MKLVHYPHAALRTKSKKVKNPQSTEVILAVQSMKKAALLWEQQNPDGICAGLAANQIGIPLRIIIVRSKDSEKAPQDPTKLDTDQLRKLYPSSILGADGKPAVSWREVELATIDYKEWADVHGSSYDPFLVMYNPRYVDGEGMIELEEGCLSIPGMVGKTLRRQKSAFFYYDHNLKRCPKEGYFEATGVNSAIICHEIEHLEGRLYVDQGLARRHVNEPYPDDGATTVKDGDFTMTTKEAAA